ncbi:MAG: thiamine pyrophosphate-dependent enzyme [Myxococcota bacterium]
MVEPTRGLLLRPLDAERRARLEARLASMVRLRYFDEQLVALQQKESVGLSHGSVGGHEAIAVGLGAGLALDDLFFPGPRDAGVNLERGEALRSWIASSRRLHQVRSGAARIPQAVGAAWGLKASGRIAAVAFGLAAYSTGDFHAACQLAGRWQVPVLLVCREDGTTRWEARGKVGLEPHLAGQGLRYWRVDGNDVLAVEATVREAADRARRLSCPTFVHCMTVRAGHLQTSGEAPVDRHPDERSPSLPIDPIHWAAQALGPAGSELRQKAEKLAKADFDEALRHAESRPPSEVVD